MSVGSSGKLYSDFDPRTVRESETDSATQDRSLSDFLSERDSLNNSQHRSANAASGNILSAVASARLARGGGSGSGGDLLTEAFAGTSGGTNGGNSSSSKRHRRSRRNKSLSNQIDILSLKIKAAESSLAAAKKSARGGGARVFIMHFPP